MGSKNNSCHAQSVKCVPNKPVPIQHQTQVGQTCMLYSASMVMDIPVRELIAELGHDGTESFSNEHGTLKHVGIHIQELQTVALDRGHHFYPILPRYALGTAEVVRTVISYEDAIVRFERLIKDKYGLIIGTNNYGNLHAIAFDGFHAFDPSNEITDIRQFSIKEAWVYV